VAAVLAAAAVASVLAAAVATPAVAGRGRRACSAGRSAVDGSTDGSRSEGNGVAAAKLQKIKN